MCYERHDHRHDVTPVTEEVAPAPVAETTAPVAEVAEVRQDELVLTN